MRSTSMYCVAIWDHCQTLVVPKIGRWTPYPGGLLCNELRVSRVPRVRQGLQDHSIPVYDPNHQLIVVNILLYLYIYIYLLGLIRSQVSTCFNHPKLVQDFAAPLYLLPPFDDKNCRSQICHGSGSSGSSGSAPGLPGLGQQLRRGGDKASRGLRLRQDLRDGRQNHDLPNVFPRNWEWTGESVDLIWFNWFD